MSWRAIFFLNLPVAASAVAVTLFAARESRDETVSRTVDWKGILALSTGLSALVLALVEGNAWGWGSPEILALTGIAVAGLGAFALLEPRVKAPMVDFSFFRSRTFLGTNVVAFSVSFAMLATFFTALYMQNFLGYGALEAGLRFLPATAFRGHGANRRAARRPHRSPSSHGGRPGGGLDRSLHTDPALAEAYEL